MANQRTLLSLCVVFSLCGCADFTVQPAADPRSPGLHFFLPKPYLLLWWERTVTVKSGTVIESVLPRYQILYLPDPSQRYTITQHVYFARGDFAYRLADGWRLEGVNGQVDTSGVLQAFSKTATAAAERAVPRAQAAGALAPKKPLPPPRLFELVWDQKKGTYRFENVELPGFTDAAVGK